MLSAFILLCIFIAGCKKELNISQKAVAVKGSKVACYPYSFNWEDPNLNWMPYPSNIISPPWTQGGSLYSTVEPDILTDRKASDGWTLVYNSFDFTTARPNPYFILYNKYRGILRIFLYVNNVNSIAPSSYLQDGISAYEYKFLNFAGAEVVDASNPKYRFDKVEPAPSDGSKPFSPNRWYMLQFEMAYDPGLTPSASSNPPQFSFYANAINIDSVKFGGTQQGTLNGTIGSSASSSNFFSTIGSTLGKSLGTGVLAAYGSKYFENHYDPTLGLGLTGSNNNIGLSNDVYENVQKGINSALSTATGDLPGKVVNIFSAILGGSSGSTVQTVSLNLSTQINLKGTITSNSNFIAPTSFYMPGSIKTDAEGNFQVQNYIPLYNRPLGVFNLASRPTVNAVYTFTSQQVNVGTRYDMTVKYTVANVPLQINPVVDSIATITNITYEVVLMPGKSLVSFKGIKTPGGRSEFLSGLPVYTANSSITGLYSTFVEEFLPPVAIPCEKNVYVRVSFNVVPKDGSPTSTIIKTFLANVNRS
jgi:hypothetical protein